MLIQNNTDFCKRSLPRCVDCAHLLLGCSIKRHIILFFFRMGVEMNFVIWDIWISRNLTRQSLLKFTSYQVFATFLVLGWRVTYLVIH